MIFTWHPRIWMYQVPIFQKCGHFKNFRGTEKKIFISKKSATTFEIITGPKKKKNFNNLSQNFRQHITSQITFKSKNFGNLIFKKKIAVSK